MELWEFNLFIKGKANAYKQKVKDTISLAYYIAGFVWNKNPKSLAFYLDEIDKKEVPKEIQEDKIKFAKEMADKIERSLL